MLNKKIIILASFLVIISILALSIVVGIKIVKSRIVKPVEVKSGQHVTPRIVDQRYLAYQGESNCDSIQDAARRKNCLQILEKAMNSSTTDECMGLAADKDKFVCLQGNLVQKAAASKDYGQCDALTNEIVRLSCKNQVAYSLAITNRDKKYCESISNKADRDSCASAAENKKK